MGLGKLVKGIIFDFDGTLCKLNIDFVEMRRRVVSLLRDYLDDDLGGLHILELVDEAARRIGLRDEVKAAEFEMRAFEIITGLELEAAAGGYLLAGVLAALREIKDMGIRVGVVTRNCRAAVSRVLEDSNFVCDVLLTREDVNKVKPDPEHIRCALCALGVEAEEAVMVGDHPLDVKAGKSLGMRVVGVLTGSGRAEELREAGADLIIADVGKLVVYLEEELRGIQRE